MPESVVKKKAPSNESDNTSSQDSLPSLERVRSRVRVNITYTVAATYCLCSIGIIFFLLGRGQNEFAVSIFAGVSGVASSIIGYWFGDRKHRESVQAGTAG